MRQRLVDAVDEQRPVRQTGQRVVGRLLGQRRLGVLQVGHPLGLGPAEPGDLTILGLLGAEVGEREAGEIVAVDVERRAPDQDRDGDAVAVDEIELDRGAEPVRALGSRPARSGGRRPRTSPAATRRSSPAEHASSSASRRLAYRISPLDDSVAAPSRMFSTNIRYGRSAVDSVKTRRPLPPSETTKASTSPAPIARSVSSASAIRIERVGQRRRIVDVRSSALTISTSVRPTRLDRDRAHGRLAAASGAVGSSGA